LLCIVNDGVCHTLGTDFQKAGYSAKSMISASKDPFPGISRRDIFNATLIGTGIHFSVLTVEYSTGALILGVAGCVSHTVVYGTPSPRSPRNPRCTGRSRRPPAGTGPTRRRRGWAVARTPGLRRTAPGRRSRRSTTSRPPAPQGLHRYRCRSRAGRRGDSSAVRSSRVVRRSRSSGAAATKKGG